MNERQVYQMKKYRTRCYVHLTIGLIKLQCGWSLNDAALFILPPGSGGHGPPCHFQTNQRKTRFLHPRSSVQLIYKTPDGQQSEKTNYGRLKRCLKEHNLLSQNGILFYFDRIVNGFRELPEDLWILQWCIHWHPRNSHNRLLHFHLAWKKRSVANFC